MGSNATCNSVLTVKLYRTFPVYELDLSEHLSRINKIAVNFSECTGYSPQIRENVRDILLDARQILLDARQNLLDVRLNLLDARLNLLDARLNLLDARQNLLDARLNLLDARLNLLDVRSGAINVLNKFSAPRRARSYLSADFRRFSQILKDFMQRRVFLLPQRKNAERIDRPTLCPLRHRRG